MLTVTSTKTIAYRDFFATSDVPTRVAYITADGGGTIGVSQREGEDVWLVDSYMTHQGLPVFVHGEGDRSCSKRILADEAVALVEEAFKS